MVLPRSKSTVNNTNSIYYILVDHKMKIFLGFLPWFSIAKAFLKQEKQRLEFSSWPRKRTSSPDDGKALDKTPLTGALDDVLAHQSLSSRRAVLPRLINR